MPALGENTMAPQPSCLHGLLAGLGRRRDCIVPLVQVGSLLEPVGDAPFRHFVRVLPCRHIVSHVCLFLVREVALAVEPAFHAQSILRPRVPEVMAHMLDGQERLSLA